jgi:hypothetical protein
LFSNIIVHPAACSAKLTSSGSLRPAASEFQKSESDRESDRESESDRDSDRDRDRDRDSDP